MNSDPLCEKHTVFNDECVDCLKARKTAKMNSDPHCGKHTVFNDECVDCYKAALESKDAALESNYAALESKDAALQVAQSEINLLRKWKRKEVQQVFVLSVSEAAKDRETVETFRKTQVGEELFRGGFVGHPLYIEFVKAARAMTRMDGNADSAHEPSASSVAKFDNVEQKLKATAALLEHRADHSLFSESHPDEEGPQSAIAAELLGQALANLQTKSDVIDIRVTHQHQIVGSVSVEHIRTLKKQKQSPKNVSSPSKKTDGDSKKKTDDRVDVLVWFIHKVDTLGACALASVEYKPSNAKKNEREAQADMYASNIHVLHRKPCIDIDIAGGNRVSEWKISAHALVPRPEAWHCDGAEHNWDKSPMYTGSGIAGIVRVAAGLLAAHSHFPQHMDDFGSRLGPVVGCHEKVVSKAYDDAKTRKPNFAAVCTLLDPTAMMWQSRDKQLVVVQTTEFDNNWKQNVTTEAFTLILDKLALLHEKYSPHGDIRLANLLSSGFIVDFDFVGAEFYPDGLNNISQDGKRHPDVKKAIENRDIGSIVPSKSHDWFSMAAVMRLFDSEKEENRNAWSLATGYVETGNKEKACTELKNVFDLVLRDKTIPLSGTGATPKKKQPYPPTMGTPIQSVKEEDMQVD